MYVSRSTYLHYDLCSILPNRNEFLSVIHNSEFINKIHHKPHDTFFFVIQLVWQFRTTKKWFFLRQRKFLLSFSYEVEESFSTKDPSK